jgi:hypothetical protein
MDARVVFPSYGFRCGPSLLVLLDPDIHNQLRSHVSWTALQGATGLASSAPSGERQLQHTSYRCQHEHFRDTLRHLWRRLKNTLLMIKATATLINQIARPLSAADDLFLCSFKRE